jgi:hypothetical protein
MHPNTAKTLYRVRMGNQDSSRAVMIPDDSIPIVENGKIVGHRVEAKKRKVES